MDLLREWIGPRVYQALTEALKWKAQGSPPADHIGQEFTFEDDGNSLRVRSSKREFVQISKIEEYARPIQLWLSDTRTFLKVIVSASAAERFERQEERRVTEGTLGAVIQILDYEIVAQHHGPKRTKITMLINNFKHIGSDGSASFGTPCSIECLPPIIEVLEKLQTLRAQEHQTSQLPASLKSGMDPVSQSNSISSADDNVDRSQAIFATQVPQLQSRKSHREGSLKRHNDQPRVLESSDSGRLKNTVHGGKDTDRRLNLSVAPAYGTKEVSRTNAEQIMSKQPKSYDQVTARKKDVHHDRSREGSEGETVGVVKDSAAKRTNDLLSLLAHNSNKTESNRVNQQAIVKPAALAKQGSQDSVPSPPAAVKESSPKSSNTQSITPVTVCDAELSPVKSSRVAKTAHGPLKTHQGSNKPARQIRKIPTRISGREVRISKIQRNLLERAESWYPPEPGHRVPTANIPISILQELNNVAEQKADLQHQSSEASNVSECSGSEDDHQEDFDSDEPIPSAEWPPSSPEQVVLPPDSVPSSAQSPERNISKDDPASEYDLNVISSVEKDLTNFQLKIGRLCRISLDDVAHFARLSDVINQAIIRVNLPLAYNHDPRNQYETQPVQAIHLPEVDEDETTFLAKPNSSGDRSSQAKLSPTSPTKTDTIESQVLTDRPFETSLSKSPDNHSQTLKLVNADSRVPEFREVTFNEVVLTSSSHFNEKVDDSISPLENSSAIEHPVTVQTSPKEKWPGILSLETIQDSEIQSGTRKDAISSDTESDLETSIPYGLDNTKDVPSTISTQSSNFKAAQPQHPILQVYSTFQGDRMDENGSSKPSEVKRSLEVNPDVSMVDTHISSIEDTVISAPTSAGFPKSSENSALPPDVEVISKMELKRKASEPVTLSPNVTKRRKAFDKNRASSEIGARNQNPDQANIMGLRLRDEFFNAFRRSSNAQNTIEGTGADSSSTKGEPEPGLNGSTEGVLQAGQGANEVEDALPQPVHPPSIFERFKATFPDYTGNSAQFAAICKRIGTLFRAHRMEHPSLWDDFIIRHRMEYPQYLSRCNDEAVDPIPYERFYRNEVFQAKYINPHGPPVATPSSIREYIASETSAYSLSEGSMVTLSEHHRHNGWPQLHLNEYRAHLAESNKTSAVQSPVISGRAMSGDIDVDVENTYTPTYRSRNHSQAGVEDYPAPGEPSSVPSLLHPALESSNTATKCSTTSAALSNPGAGAERRESPTVDASSLGPTHEQEVPANATELLRTESPSVISRPNQTSHPPNARKSQSKKAVIELSSGSEVEEVPGKTTPVREVAKAKQTRRSLPWQSPGRDSNGRATTVIRTASSIASPAPTPRGVSKTSLSRDTRLKNAVAVQHATIAKTVPPSHTSPVKNTGESSTPIDLSKDRHSPYNTFVRDYKAITPGKGNSYAKAGQSQRKPSGLKKRRPVDPLKWEL
ncbi:hypothetical protein G7Y79_00018g044720 [Physcia stellaris]|nr:hypothetical protein G7Y79_00018g044720 [Physcia stellaris]